jgi:hypothetical protein
MSLVRTTTAGVAVAAALAALASGCAEAGAGSGLLVAPVPTGSASLTSAPLRVEGPVLFAWKTVSGSRGSIAATLPDGRTFSGTFVEPTTAVRNVDEWTPLDCGAFGCTSSALQTTTTTTLSGELDAALSDSASTRMTCRFKLNDPQSGPLRGGIGQCALSTGERIEAAELHQGAEP